MYIYIFSYYLCTANELVIFLLFERSEAKKELF